MLWSENSFSRSAIFISSLFFGVSCLRLDLETAMLLAVAILLYPYIYIYFPEVREGATFYLLLAIGATLVIFLLTGRFPVDLDNRKILDTASLVFLNMLLNAIFFALLAEYLGFYSFLPSIMLYLTTVPVIYALYVGLGEALIYVGLPLALTSRLRGILQYVPAVVINVLFAFYFALLHMKAYGFNYFIILQPFFAFIINSLIAIRNKNLAGVVIGHWMADAVIFLSGALV